MFVRNRRFSPLFDADKGDGAGGSNTDAGSHSNDLSANGNAAGQQGDAGVTFTAEQQAEINKIVGKARQDGRTAAEQALSDKQKKSDEERARTEAVARGEFDKVKAELETKLADVSTEKESLTERIARYDAAMAPVIADQVKAIPAEAMAGFPTSGTPLEQLAWINDPRTQAVIALSGRKAAANVTVFPNTKRPTQQTPEQLVEDAKQRARASGSYGL